MRRRWPWFGTGVLFLGNLLLHKPLSDVCDWASSQLGFVAYDRLALATLGGAQALLAGFLLWRWRDRYVTASVAACVVCLGALTVAAQRWLLVANIELVHLPQYAVLAVLIAAGGATPQHAWLGATALGVADEACQRLVIYAARPEAYLDYNDMVLNAIGAAWAVALAAPLLASRPSRAEAQSSNRADAMVLGITPEAQWRAGGFAIVLSLAVWLDPPRLFPILQKAATGRPYRVLSAAEALLIAQVLRTILSLTTLTRSSPKRAASVVSLPTPRVAEREDC